MSAIQLSNSQPTADVCSPGSPLKMSRISAPAYGIGEHDPAVGPIRRWTPRTKAKVQVGNCRWCDAPLWKSTKPPKDCGNTCAKAFSRHVNRLGSLDFLGLKKDKDSQLGRSGGLKAIWEQLKAIDREIKKTAKEFDCNSGESVARMKELRAAARGLLCKTPKSRGEFVRPLQYAFVSAKDHVHHHQPVTEAKKRIGTITAPPEPTPIAFEQHKTYTKQIIGPARPRRGWKGKNKRAIQVVNQLQ